jgi:tetratricopeptide (TPR) repeat protein
MKKLCFFLSIFLLSVTIKAQSEKEFQEYSEKIEKQRSEFWKTKQFGKAADLLKEANTQFNSQSNELKTNYNSIYCGNLYNIACAHSLNKDVDSAVVYFRKAIDAGFKDYANAKVDTDLDNIRKEPKFIESLAKLREKGDYEFILKKYSAYKSIDHDMPVFTYLSKDTKVLTDLRKKYNLDEVAGNGDEISRFINLMKWVHKTVRHDGNSSNPKVKSADAIIEICKTEKRGVNCRMMATILNEVYLSMGYKSRFITCMPQGEIFDDCHVINEVYSNALHKWVWMDPTFETYVTDDNGMYLSIQETRYRLVNGLPVNASKEINWNGQTYGGGGETYLHGYMAKNLYRFSIPLKSCSAYENLPMNERTYLELYPVGYNPKNVELGKATGNSYYTTDDAKYWAAPKNQQ